MIPIAIYLVGCILCGVFGRDKVIGFWGFFLVSIFLTPIVSFVILMITMPRAGAKPSMNGVSFKEMWQRTRGTEA